MVEFAMICTKEGVVLDKENAVKCYEYSFEYKNDDLKQNLKLRYESIMPFSHGKNYLVTVEEMDAE